jgi:predicted metal-dependent hydrolase
MGLYQIRASHALHQRLASEWKKGHDIMPGKMSDLASAARLDCHGPLHPKAVEGLDLFNRGLYFEAHEALEAAWREEVSPIRELYRGILQAAVVYLHITRANLPGALKVYARSQKWLAPWPDRCRGIEVGQLRRDLEQAIQQVEALDPQRLSALDPSFFKPVVYAKSRLQG